MVNGGFYFQNLSRWSRELKLCVIDLKEHWDPMLLHFTSDLRKVFNTKSGSVNEACKKKRCTLMYLLTNIHCGV